MMLEITQNKSIYEVQQDFNRQYPFLKLEFYNTQGEFTKSKKKHVLNTLSVATAGLTRNGNVELSDVMTVGQLENILQAEFGLSAQVSRKSGVLWLETTMTNGWTLKQQNEHGRELAEVFKTEEA